MKFSAAALVLIVPAFALAKPVHPSVGLPSLGLPTLGLPGLGQPTPVVPTPASSVPVTVPTPRTVLPIPESALPTAALAARWADGDPCPVSPLQCCESSYAHDSTVGSALLKSSGQEDYRYGNVAVGCSPVIGSVCSAEPNCCASTGLVAAGCVPVTV